jgi:hypothetical protein
MKTEDRTNPIDTSGTPREEIDGDGEARNEEEEAEELRRKIDEIERKVADGN